MPDEGFLGFNPVSVLVFAAFLTACGAEATDPAPLPLPPCPQVAGVTVTPDNVEIAIGDSLQFRAVAFGGCHGEPAPTFVWRFQSSDPLLLVVDSLTGLAHGRRGGTVAVRATGVAAKDGGARSGAATVTVVGPNLVRISPAKATVAQGDSVQFTATLTPAGSTLPLRWSLSNSDAGTISDSGLFRACWPGAAAEVSAVAGGDTATARVTITSPPFRRANIQSVDDAETGAPAPLDSLRADADVLVETNQAWFPCRRVTEVSLSIDDGRGSGTLLGRVPVGAESGAVVRRFRLHPSAIPPGDYGLQATAVVDGRFPVGSNRVVVRIRRP
jgi:hypothetical protein